MPQHINQNDINFISNYYQQHIIILIRLLKYWHGHCNSISTQHHWDLVNNTCLQTLGRQALKGNENVCH